MLAPQPPQQMKNIVGKLPPVTEDNSRDMQRLRASLLDEVNTDYDFSLRKSIGSRTLQRYIDVSIGSTFTGTIKKLKKLFSV